MVQTLHKIALSQLLWRFSVYEVLLSLSWHTEKKARKVQVLDNVTQCKSMYPLRYTPLLLASGAQRAAWKSTLKGFSLLLDVIETHLSPPFLLNFFVPIFSNQISIVDNRFICASLSQKKKMLSIQDVCLHQLKAISVNWKQFRNAICGWTGFFELLQFQLYCPVGKVKARKNRMRTLQPSMLLERLKLHVSLLRCEYSFYLPFHFVNYI